MNAVNGRFNRTIQEEFVDYEENLSGDDPSAFNLHLLDYLDRYHGKPTTPGTRQPDTLPNARPIPASFVSYVAAPYIMLTVSSSWSMLSEFYTGDAR